MSDSCRAPGYTRDELLNSMVWETDARWNPESWLKHFAELRQHGSLRFEADQHHRDGRVIPVEIAANYVNVGAKEYNYIFVRDITERKQAEAARAALEAQLRESQKMEAIGTLAGGIAHDFNNALATILGNVELARQDVGPGHEALVSLEEIGKASRRAKDLVQQILAFSRRQTLERKATSRTHCVRFAPICR